MSKSKIAWTGQTITNVTSCTKFSRGCENCYSLGQSNRMKALHPAKYGANPNVVCHPGILEHIIERKKPTTVFLNSMSDTFHAQVPLAFLQYTFGIMQNATQHTFQVLTKRAERLAHLAPQLPWPENIWQGVTVEANEYLHRIELLKQVPANVRFISIEPLLDELTDLTPEMLGGIDWVIVGGESGPRARRMELDWARSIMETCRNAEVPFFFKQSGSAYGKHKGGDKLDGEIIQQWPDLEKVKTRGPRWQPDGENVVQMITRQ
jgi:protein gp37